MSIGFRVFTQRELPTADVIEGFKTIPAANIADCMGRLSAMNCRIRRMTAPAEQNMVGVALTVKARPGDNLMMHKALNMIKPGDILIVSNEGDSSQSLMGEIMVAYAKSQGIAGIVLDGPMRDLDTIYAMGVPVYATGHTPGGPFKEGPGEVNVPVACGNIHVTPGDIIVGDSDGVIVIPKHDAAKLLEEARKFSANDHAKLVAAQTGKADRSWVDKALAAKGCETIDAVYPG
ncbi:MULTISPECIES: RraA family protein [Citrobacter]|uniref:RraA family protein n=1 Tax=Citrobacter TaxID=544 RepID=UPI0010777143|nr:MULTISPECIES: RraA family protein [unclassified Citrobacter]MDA8498851.1 RraA family protein [Citrobacter sp. Igbk 17]MDA8503521.1 RraA family protein [Citrobacter sp. Awk 2]MDA8513912.1 RraA family protein [Citrobacter sp. Igbk 14]MDA8515491.1 RraA family protein [Citrobacter sp. Igbk 16]MDW2644413.1 RraA family protein [Citrobacter sp. HN-141]